MPPWQAASCVAAHATQRPSALLKRSGFHAGHPCGKRIARRCHGVVGGCEHGLLPLREREQESESESESARQRDTDR